MYFVMFTQEYVMLTHVSMEVHASLKAIHTTAYAYLESLENYCESKSDKYAIITCLRTYTILV